MIYVSSKDRVSPEECCKRSEVLCSELTNRKRCRTKCQKPPVTSVAGDAADAKGSFLGVKVLLFGESRAVPVKVAIFGMLSFPKHCPIHFRA